MFHPWKPKKSLPTSAGAWAGLLAGAGIMYLLDPVSGRRRRALIRDKFVHLGNLAGERAQARARDLGNRLTGAAAKARGSVRSDELPDDVLAERIRSRMGRLVADPAGVEVSVEDGRVELLGRAGEQEAERLVKAVGRVRGVRNVQSRLDISVTGGNGPAS